MNILRILMTTSTISAVTALTCHAETINTQVLTSSACIVPVSSSPPTMVSPPRTEVRTIPAQYQSAVRQELVTPEQVSRQIEPAVYAPVAETKIVTPARVVRREVPATSQVVHTPVSVVSGYSAVSYGLPYAPIAYYAGALPAPMYTTVSTPLTVQQIVTTPAYIIDEVIPAEVRTEVRNVMVRPERSFDVVTPATYRTVSYMQEIVPARTETVSISPVFETRVTSHASCAAAPSITTTAMIDKKAPSPSVRQASDRH